MFKKLLIPLAALSTLAGITTSFVAGSNMLQDTKPAAHSEAIPLAKVATATPKATKTATPIPLTTVLPSEKYDYKGDGSPGLLSVMIKNGKHFKTYPSDVQALRPVGKCVVNFYAQTVQGTYTTGQQQVTSEKLIQQYTSTLKVKNVKIKEGSLLSNESYGTDEINYKIDAAYSKFTAKAVHGVVYARMFNDGLGYMLSVSCPTKTKIPSLSSVVRIKTDDGVVKASTYYPDEHRLAL